MHDYRLVLPAAILWFLTIVGTDITDLGNFSISSLKLLGIALGAAFALAVAAWKIVQGTTSLWPEQTRDHHAITANIKSIAVLALCMFCIGIGNNSVHNYLQERDPLVQAATKNASVTVQASISGKERKMRAFSSYNIASIELDGRASRQSACLRISPGANQHFNIGDPIRVRGQIRMGKSKQTCQLVIAAEHISVNGEPSLISVFINRIHGDFADVLAGIESSETDASALVQGIVLGDDSQLSDDMRRSMKNQSLSHLTAVSGSHISILLLAVFSVLGQRRAWLAAIFGALTITVLTLIVGPSASVLRALYMGLFVVFGVGMRRPRDAIALLATTVIVVCFVNPQLSTQIGFILSVLATFGIVSGGSQLAQRISVIMPLWCAELIAIPLIASISTLPVIFTMQSSMSIWGVLANMVIAPVVAPLTICGLAALTVVSFAPHIATLFVWGAYICSRWIIYVVGVIEYFPASHIPTIIVFLSHLLLLFGLIGLARVRPRTRARAKAIIGTRTRRKIHLRTQSFYAAFKSKFLPFITPITAWQRGAAPAQIAFLGLVFLAAILGVHKLVLPVSPTQIADWEIIQCDVGQGSAMLLRASSDTVLVDVGKDPSKIASCLNDNSITTIDLLILSHFDLDHIGGASAIIGKIEVKEIWLSTNPYPLYNSEPLMRTITRHNIPYQSVKAGQSFHNWLRIIHPRSASGGEENTNRDSLVIDAKTATLHTVILSDVPKDVQDDLSNEASEVDVVVVSHHGAKDQSARLAKAYKPKITLVSVGENTYGHPTEEAHKIWDAPMYLTTLECKTIKIGHGEVEASCFDAG